ncbi:MAG: C-GCAxxG-C-C family protein [bacterium]
MSDNKNVLEEVEKSAYENLMSKRTLACSQAVNLAIQEKLFDGEVDELIIKALAPFAGGSRENSLCGALVGGIMALGIKYGVEMDQMSSLKSLKDSYQPAIKFYKEFDKENKSRFCFDIIGYNLNIEEERDEWLEQNGWELCAKRCGQAARSAAKIILEDQ